MAFSPTYPRLQHVHEAAANQGDGRLLQGPSQAVQLTSAHLSGSTPDDIWDGCGMVVGIASMVKFLKSDIPRHFVARSDVGIQLM